VVGRIWELQIVGKLLVTNVPASIRAEFFSIRKKPQVEATHSPVDLVDRIHDTALSDVALHVAGIRIAGYSYKPARIDLENTRN